MVQVQPKTRYVTVNGLQLRSMEWGQRKEPPMLLLHGLRSHAASWSEAGQTFASYFRPAAFDQRGRGGSDWAPDGDYSLEAHTRDVEAYADAMGLGPSVVIGDSLGGRAAMLYAARRQSRVAALVLVDVGPELPKAGADRLKEEMRRTPESFKSWDDARNFVLRERPAITMAALEERIQWMLKEEDGRIVWRYDKVIRDKCREGTPPGFAKELWEHLPSIVCPTLIIRGSDSDFLSAEMAERMVRSMRRAQWVEIAGAGHAIMEEAPKAFLGTVRRFLSRQGMYAPPRDL